MSRPLSIAKRTQLAGLLLLGCMSVVIATDKLAELSDEFLEYLGSMEGDDETWLDFTAELDAQPHSTQNSLKSGKASVGSSSSSAASRASSVNTSAVSKTTGKAEQ